MKLKTPAICHPNRSARRKDGLCDSCRKKVNGSFPKASITPQHQLQRREYRFRKMYGFSLIQLQKLYHKQRKLCPICQCPFELEKLHVDHDHCTNVVRGLLCRHCNYGLGNFKDNPASLMNAILYLAKSWQIFRRGNE